MSFRDCEELLTYLRRLHKTRQLAWELPMGVPATIHQREFRQSASSSASPLRSLQKVAVDNKPYVHTQSSSYGDWSRKIFGNKTTQGVWTALERRRHRYRRPSASAGY